MCNICHQIPCHPQCPNADEPSTIGVCAECGEPLRVDYQIYTDNNEELYCSQECAAKYNGIREIIDKEVS